MQKKIIAVACAVILIATLFASCGKKLYTQEINGVERAVVTDENGDLITDNEGLIRVYETNTKGEIVTNQNGEPEYNYVEPPKSYVSGNSVVVDGFKLGIPEGFEADGRGGIVKKGTDDKCYINVAYTTAVSMDKTFAAYMYQTDASNAEIVKKINDGEFVKDGIKAAETDKRYITIGETNAEYTGYKVISTDDKVVHYAVTVYFLVGSDMYCLSYVCADGVGYDENFDFEAWIQNSFTITK